MPPIPPGRWAIVCLQCTRRYRSFAAYLEHSTPVHNISRPILEAATVTVTGTPGTGFWWHVGIWALVAQPMTVKGEPSQAGTHEPGYTHESGAHVLRVDDVNGSLAVCDLDGDQPVTWAYPARRFIGPSGGMMGGPTATCEACHVLIERRDVARLLRRIQRRIPMAARVVIPIEAMLHELLAQITGPAVEIGT